MYRVTYYPLSDPNAGGGGLVELNSRVFTATGLTPRTSYFFQVQAFNLFTIVQGSVADLTVTTSNPSSKLLNLQQLTLKSWEWCRYNGYN